MKVRVYQLARELKVENDALVEIITELGGEVKNHMSSLDEALVDQVRSRVLGNRSSGKREPSKKEPASRVASGQTVKPPTSSAPTAVAQEPTTPPPTPASKPKAPASTSPATSKSVPKAPPATEKKASTPASKRGDKTPRQPSAPDSRPPAGGPGGPRPGGPPRGRPSPTPQDTGEQPLGPSRTPHVGQARPASRPLSVGSDRRGDNRRKKKRGRQVDEQAVLKSVRQTMAGLDGARGRKRRRRGGGSDVADDVLQPLNVHEYATVGELASVMEVKPNEIIATCLQLGIMANINRQLEKDEIEAIMVEFGQEPNFVTEYGAEKILEEEVEVETDHEKVARAPIVTVMGHVDHGKTTLLDHIRDATVTEQESGGITQHIGAYRVELPRGTICFLDTPGHEAFTAMRARGAKVTDAVVLVVAANDEVRPQTIEAINHAKAAEVPLVVAINKIDVNGANPDNIRKGLADAGIQVESWGGKVVDVEISAKHGQNVDKLLEMILLEAELLELKAQPARSARGAIIESRRDAGKGILATVLVQDGTMRVGDPFVCGSQFGRVRAMVDEHGERLSEAGPSTPVEVLGWDGVPFAGDSFVVMANETKAREIAAHRAQIARTHSHRLSKQRVSIASIHERIQAGDLQELNVIIKADVAGSVEVLRDKLESLGTSEVKVNVIHVGVGLISVSDVQLAMASRAIIVGFHTRADTGAHRLALAEDIEIRLYQVIYDVEQEIKDAMSGLLSPEMVEKASGSAEVRQVFNITKVGAIAGCMVVSGKIHRNDKARVFRGVDVVFEGGLSSLKRVKDDAKEVAAGFECGIGLAGFDDLVEGDVIEAFTVSEVARKIE